MEIPGFEVIEKIGEGGMATVWKARQVSLNRVVAVKVLSAKFAEEQSDTARFVSEAQSMANMKHSGLIQVYDANISDGSYYFVMEYIAGYSVGEWIRRKGRIPERDALITADYVADALNYAWKTQRTIHCDIKPDNVMIDADGTIKVADLGLARTIGTASHTGELEDEVMGTPNYMAPEQVMGEPDLDCRADIYALGATLYHMITGKMMFDGSDPGSVMEKQTADFVDDPLDLNPKASMGVCWLIEKMLAREREDRYRDWDEVLEDIARVKSGHMIRSEEVAEGASVCKRSSRRTKPARRYNVMAVEEKKKFPVIPILVLGILAAAAVAFVIIAVKRQPEQPSTPERPSRIPMTQSERAASEEKARKMYEFAVKWAKDNPASYDEAIRKFIHVAMETRGTEYALMADEKSKELKVSMEKAISQVLGKLKAEAGPLEADDDFDAAIAVYKDYRGRYHKEASDERRREVSRLEDAREAYQEDLGAAMGEKRFDQLEVEVVSRLLEMGPSSALKMVEKAQNSPSLRSMRDDIESLEELVESVDDVDSGILDSFRDQIGDTVTVRVPAGTIDIEISDVQNGRILGEQKVTSGAYTKTEQVELEFADLSVRELLRRMGDGDSPAELTRRGLLAYDSGSHARAIDYFEAARSDLSRKLAQRVKSDLLTKLEKKAQSELASVMRAAGYDAGEYDHHGWLNTISSRMPTAGEARMASARLSQYARTYGDTEFAKKAGRISTSLRKKLNSVLR